MSGGVRRATAMLAALALILAASTIGCGRRGSPRPPEDVLPETIDRLEAHNQDAAVLLTWPRPENYTGGGKMSDLGEFIVERAVGSAPPAEFHEIKRIPVEDRDRFRQVKNFRYVDKDVLVGIVYRYRVLSRTTDDYESAASNEVEIVHTRDE